MQDIYVRDFVFVKNLLELYMIEKYLDEGYKIETAVSSIPFFLEICSLKSFLRQKKEKLQNISLMWSLSYYKLVEIIKSFILLKAISQLSFAQCSIQLKLGQNKVSN